MRHHSERALTSSTIVWCLFRHEGPQCEGLHIAHHCAFICPTQSIINHRGKMRIFDVNTCVYIDIPLDAHTLSYIYIHTCLHIHTYMHIPANVSEFTQTHTHKDTKSQTHHHAHRESFSLFCPTPPPTHTNTTPTPTPTHFLS